MDFLLNRQKVNKGFVNPTVGIVSLRTKQAPKGVLHRTGRPGIDVTLDRGEMDNVLTNKIIRNMDPFREDLMQYPHLRLGSERDPPHVPLPEIEQHGNLILPKDRYVFVQVFTLKRVCDNSFVLHTYDVLEP